MAVITPGPVLADMRLPHGPGGALVTEDTVSSGAAPLCMNGVSNMIVSTPALRMHSRTLSGISEIPCSSVHASGNPPSFAGKSATSPIATGSGPSPRISAFRQEQGVMPGGRDARRVAC
jgi:hypothetical protein